MNYADHDLFGRVDIAAVIRQFLQQTRSGNLKTKGLYPAQIGVFKLEVSFGQGNVSGIPWVAVLGAGQRVSCGIYPVFLYFKADDHLILAYGVSETEAPPFGWGPLVSAAPVIASRMKEHGFLAKRYGDSYVGAEYPRISELVESGSFEQQVKQDLANMLVEYRQLLSNQPVAEAPSQMMFESDEPEEMSAVEARPQSLNQILYGPPGTGKTYATIDHALQILDPTFMATHSSSDVSSRQRLKARFDELVKARRIRFVTFHQSFSYEDFVEGLRAVTTNGQLQYKVEAGVFKLLCDEARRDVGIVSPEDVLNQFLEEVAEVPVTLNTIRGKAFDVRYKPGNTTFTCIPKASETGLELPANIDHVRLFMRSEKPSSVYCESYVRGIADYLKTKLQVEPGHDQPANREPYLLIIDEINRGNVSRIFGELISLIEDSKREGAPEALSAALPYSKDPFSVPANVYLLGTMNTADRSLAGLDIALRRRFTFKEMPPRYDLLDDVVVEGINIGQLLQVINQRIEVLLDRDHCLGHAYFMSLKSSDPLVRLESIFRNQILPLLQEYFFEDWQRIQWVLNDHRKPKADRFVEHAQPDLNSLFGSSVTGVQGGVWRVMTDAFTRVSAYSGIIAVKPELHIVEAENDAIAESEG
ncbi:AAA family ATPase [Pseudomonas sp. NPDC078700]|uniref:AAA family ATPase n=1 Tax=Pseudomonas sp. NPDC078700 TaxID=3364424 RepID=UPI0037C80F81